VGRALPIVRTFISIVAGFVKVPLMMFALLSLLGTAVWVTAITLIGYAVGTEWQKVAHGFALAGYVILAVAVIGIAVFIWHRLREVRKEKAAADGAAPGAHQPKHRSPTA